MAADVRFPAMGSEAHVVVVGDGALAERARRRLAELEQRWSRFLWDSEVSRLNRARGRGVVVSSDTLLLVRRALAAWAVTGGRFDPTVLGDVIRAGYDRPFEAIVLRPRRGPGSGGAPSASALHRGAGRILVDPARREVTLPADVGFDPGGIGKGLAADLVVAELLAAGATGVCVNVGGDLRVAGASPEGGPWGVDVEAPDGPGVVARLALVAGGVATSTTARRRWVVDGEERHHLIDPRRGRPARTRVVSATAVAGDAATAEAAAKAVLLAGGRELLAGGRELLADRRKLLADGPVLLPGVDVVPHVGAVASPGDCFAALGCAGLVVLDDGSTYRSPSLDPFLVTPPGAAAGPARPPTRATVEAPR
jgi:thiamine biosynthesis lipoprotein